MKFLHVDTIIARPMAGCSIAAAIREAVILAMEQTTDVKLVFNNKEYVVDYQEIFDSIVNKYGEE